MFLVTKTVTAGAESVYGGKLCHNSSFAESESIALTFFFC